MSYDFSPATSKMLGTLTTSRSMPQTLACFIKIADHPASTDYTLTLSKDAENNEYIALQTHGTEDRYQALIATSVPNFSGAVYIAGVGEYDGAWLPIVGTFVSTTERNIFVELLANTSTNATSRDPSSVLAQVTVGATPGGGSRFDGLIAECAMWDGELSDANITSYLAGNAASGIDAANLLGYWPLDTNRDGDGTILNEGTDATGTLTITNATFDADHPTIISGSNTTITIPTGPWY